MTSPQETPEQLRERLRQEDLKRNPSSAFGDGINRAGFGSFADLIGGMGWKGTGFILTVLIVGYIIYKIMSS